MKNCTHCKHADWKRREGGNLHPSGDGYCRYEWKMPPLPSAFYFISGAPIPCGGLINRKQEHKDHCPYYTQKQ